MPVKSFIILILNLSFIMDVYRPMLYGSSEFTGIESPSTPTIESCDSGTNESCLSSTTESDFSEKDFVTRETSVLLNTNVSTKETTGVELTVLNNSTMTEISIDVGTVKDLSSPSNDQCFCDITVNACDVNCCCDIDCNSFDRTAFSECYIQPSLSPKHSGLCLFSKYIYKNNTQYSVLTTNDGMFCIVHNNYPDILKYTNDHTITSLDQFYKVLLRNKLYTWPPSKIIGKPTFDCSQPYKFGSPLWKYINDTEKDVFKVLEFPVSVTTSVCDSTKELLYLVNTDTKCLRSVPKTKQDCVLANSNVLKFVEPFILVSSPPLVNSTQYSASPTEAFTRLETFLCNSTVCSEVNTFPNSSFKNGTCENIIRDIHIHVKHNGSFGLVQSQCFIYLTNELVTNETFNQEYKLTFEWARNTTGVFKRSGRPGYINNKPVISARKNNAMNHNKGTVLVSREEEDWISFITSSKYGFCEKRINILFNQNLRTQCVFRFKKEMTVSSTNCTVLQNEVWKLLLGNVEINKTINSQLNLYIASYGDLSSENTLEWVPIWLEIMPYQNSERLPCLTVLSSISLHIIYSHVGSLAHPQAKIIGASLKAYNSEVLCNNEHCQVEVISSVLFTDVSNRAKRKFAEPPVIKIKLPEDFFYPFLSGGSSHVSYNIFLLIILLILLT